MERKQSKIDVVLGNDIAVDGLQCWGPFLHTVGEG